MMKKLKLPQINKGELIMCKRCKSTEITKCGFRQAIYRGDLQRYCCSECGYRFTLEDRKWYPPEMKAFAIKLWLSGIPSRKAERIVYEKFGYSAHYNVIIKWVEQQGLHKPLSNQKKLLINLQNLKKIENNRKKDKRIIVKEDKEYFNIPKEDLNFVLMINNHNRHKDRIPIIKLGICKKEGFYNYLIDVKELNWWLNELSSKQEESNG
jgi:transposase-like protein